MGPAKIVEMQQGINNCLFQFWLVTVPAHARPSTTATMHTILDPCSTILYIPLSPQLLITELVLYFRIRGFVGSRVPFSLNSTIPCTKRLIHLILRRKFLKQVCPVLDLYIMLYYHFMLSQIQ